MESIEAGPSRIPYDASRGPSEGIASPRQTRSRARTCPHCVSKRQQKASLAAMGLIMALIPSAAATDYGPDQVPDHFIKVDEVWVRSNDWSLNGRSYDEDFGIIAAPGNWVQADSPLTSIASGDPSSTTTATASPSAASPSAPTPPAPMNVPANWVPDERTEYWAVPVIVVSSLVTAASIIIAIIFIVYWRRTRRQKAAIARREDLEQIDDASNNEKPKGKGAKLATAVRRKTLGLRRRGKRKTIIVASARTLSSSGAAPPSDVPDEEEQDVGQTVVSHPLMRQTSIGSASAVSISTMGGADSDAEESSITALTRSGGARSGTTGSRSRRSGPTIAFFGQPLHSRRSAVSIASMEAFPSAPPAYVRTSSTEAAAVEPRATPSRRDEKRRAIEDLAAAEDEAEAEHPPALSDEAPPSIDRSEYIGHVAVDEKAELSRRAGMASAPEGASSSRAVELSAPAVDQVEHAMIEAAMDEDVASVEEERLPVSAPSSRLPAPPQAIVSSFKGLRRPAPSAPPVAVSAPSAPSAPPLPDYEAPVLPSLSEVIESIREEHAEV